MSASKEGQRVVRQSPSPLKQGPMKATIPMSSLLKQSSTLRTAISPSSPTTSTTWRLFRVSPEHLCAGQRSPGATLTKANMKSRTMDNVNQANMVGMRRTVSLDMLYLQGQWPRDNLFCISTALQIDKSTQTDDCDWIESHRLQLIHNSDKMIRQRLQRSGSRVQTSPVAGDHTLTTSSQTNTSFIIPRATPVNIPIKPLPKPTMRSSVEGLNQEIERLVLKSCSSSSFNRERSDDYDKLRQSTPEGHRAPFPDLFRNTRSVNTQTPTVGDLSRTCRSTSGSRGSSPEQDLANRLGTSPRIFSARAPPDGCERVSLLTSTAPTALETGPMRHPCVFELKPSQGSAFKMLQPTKMQQQQNLPLVPSTTTTATTTDEQQQDLI